MPIIPKNVELKIKTLLDRGYRGNPDTGEVFTSKNKLATSRDASGYHLASTYLDKKFISVRVSYFLWYLKYGTVPDQLRYINGDRNDNRISNLEEVKRKKDQIINTSIEIDIGNKELLKEIKRNLNRIPGFNTIIDKHIKNTITNEAYLKVISMIGNKTISNKFEEVKGYIFILCKNEVYLTINPRKTDLKINRNYEDLSTLNLYMDDYNEEDEVFFSKVLDHLLNKNYLWYQIILLKLQNKSNKEIKDELETPLWNIETERKKVYQYIKRNVDKFRI